MKTFSLSFTPLFGQILLAHEVTELYLHTKGKKTFNTTNVSFHWTADIFFFFFSLRENDTVIFQI